MSKDAKRTERERNGLLNGWFEAGCHTPTAFSTYHDMRRGVCQWCHRTEAELVTAGAMWLVWPNKRDNGTTEQPVDVRGTAVDG